MNQVPREVDKMTREFAEKMIGMANESLMAIRNGMISNGSNLSHECGYIEGLTEAVKMAGYKVSRDYSDKNQLFVLVD